MKSIFTLLFLLLTLAAHAEKKPTHLQWNVRDACIERSGDKLAISFGLKLDSLRVKSEEAVLFTPVIKSNITADSLVLPAIGVYGRNRYIHYERVGMLTGPDERAMRFSQRPDTLIYIRVPEYERWMADVNLKVNADTYGCCFTLLAHDEKTPADYFEPPTFDDIKPPYLSANPREVVEKSLEGSALIQFVVDRTEVKPDWRDNYRELGKITHSIDTVKADPDFTITSVWLKGFASPESPYSHNTDLARGRVASVKQYVQNLYRFPDGLITTDYEPEDWAGLRRYVEASNLDSRQSILDIIDNVENDDLDKKEAELKRRHPADYRFLLDQAYPPLRHTEYRITYTVRRAADIDEIKRRLATEPTKLTLNEFYLAANTYKADSPEFRNVFDVCARIYPTSQIANLNAAGAAMQAGNLDDAERFLRRAGNGQEANFSRALLLLRRGQYQEALPLVREAARLAVPGAPETLKRLEQYTNRNKQ